MRIEVESRSALALRRLTTELDLATTEADPLIDDIRVTVARVGKLQAAMQKIIEGDYPRVRAKIWAKDGGPSKHDQCPHALFFWEGCEQCVCDYLREAMRDG